MKGMMELKRILGRKIGIVVLVLVTVAALLGCAKEGIADIDNGELRFEEITTIEVTRMLPIDDEVIRLNDEEIKDFVSLVNSFELKRDDEAQSDKIGTPFVFTLAQPDGSETMLQYFDNILTVNSKDRYRISEGDGTMLMDYCDRVYLYEPELVKICRQYINEKKTFSAKAVNIDYSIYRIEEMTLDGYKSAAFITDEKVTEKNIGDYRMITVGDTQPDEIGMHNYAVLLVDVKNKVVKGYAPTK